MATVEALETGVSFGLTEEQRALRDLAHDFAEKEIRPKAAEYDEHQTHPADVIGKAHEVGLMNPHMPEELGGAGLGALEGALIGEELCWGCSGIGTSIIANILGSKMFITNAGQAAWLTVFASTDKDAGHRGLTAFVVPTDADGVTIEKHLDKMGQRATDTSAIAFQDVQVPAANRLGEEGEGFKIAMRTLDHTRH